MNLRQVVLIWLIGLPLFCHGQLQRILHQTFETDSIQQIQVDIDWELVTKPWAGNNILTETQVKLYDAGNAVFEFHITNGRYRIIADTLAEGSIRLRLMFDERVPIQTKNGICLEEVNLTIYLPDRYLLQSNGVWVLKEEELELRNRKQDDPVTRGDN